MAGRVCRHDDGFAMVFVMGAIAVVTAIAFGGYALASQSLHSSVRNTSEHRAYQAASTGLDQELSWFRPEDLSRYPTAPQQLGTEGDTYVARVEEKGGGIYELQCSGRSGTASETVVVRFKYMNLWDMNVSGGEGSGVGTKSGFNGSSWVWGSLYVNGNVDWTSNGRLYEGPIFLKNGTWNASGNGQVGTTLRRVDAYGPVPTGGNYFTTLRGSAPDLEIPKISDKNMADWLVMAKHTAKSPRVGTRHANAHAVDYTVWTGASTIGNVDFGNINVDPIAYRRVSANQGVVYLNQVDTNGDGDKDTDPVIVCDNIITFNANVTHYKGRGIIVAKNGFVIDGGLIPLSGLTEQIGPATDQKTVPVMTGQDCLGLLSQGDINATTKTGKFPASGICAAVFVNGRFIVPTSGNLDFRGSLICDSLEVRTTNAILATQPGLYKSLPKGMPELSGFTARGDWVRR